MQRLRLLSLLACFAGCNGLFGIDVPPIADTQNRGGGGGAGAAGNGAVPEAGEPNSGIGGEPQPELGGNGGASGEAGGGATTDSQGGATSVASAGTRGARGGTTAASAGRKNESGAGGHTAGQGGSSAGTSAAGGPPTNLFPDLDAPCAPEGAAACIGPARAGAVHCHDGSWRVDTCGMNELCDSRSGACSPVYAGCSNELPGYAFCSADDPFSLVTCGSDLVTADVENCVYGCTLQGTQAACGAPVAGSLTVEQPPVINGAGSYWPGTSVPVCFTTPQTQNEWEVVEDELGRTWGRYASIGFGGFEACSDDATGVLVTFRAADDPCTDELGDSDRIGYPGNGGSVHITLCLAYDQAGGSGSTSEALLRLVARHEFGHALGFPDVSDHRVASEFMSRAIDSGTTAYYPFLAHHISLLEQAYGFKPSGALVDVRGFCLTSGTDPPAFSSCDARTAQAFHFENGQIHGSGDASCLKAAANGTLSFAACTPAGATPDPAQTWNPTDVHVRGYGGVCLFSYNGVLPGDLAVKACEDVAALGLWQVEFTGDGSRVRLHDWTGHCLAMEEYLSATVSVNIRPADCGDCDETHTRCSFGLTDDEQIASDDYCLTVPSATVYSEDGFSPPAEYDLTDIDACSLDRRMAFSLSGHFVNGNNQVLGVLTRDRGYELIAAPVDADPTAAGIETEVFDYFSRAE